MLERLRAQSEPRCAQQLARSHLDAADLFRGTRMIQSVSEPCECFSGDFRERPRAVKRHLQGHDDHYADVTVETCTRCGAAWLDYHVEYEHRTAGGHWARGHIDSDTAQRVTAQTASAILEALPWYWVGGSYYSGHVHRSSGPIRYGD